MLKRLQAWKLPAWLPPMTTPLRGTQQTPQPMTLAPRMPAGSRYQGFPHQTKPQGIQIALSHRWFLAGMTGCGKTTFAKRLLLKMRQMWPQTPLYILDSKGQLDDFGDWLDRGYARLSEGDSAPRLLRGDGVQLWRPPADDLSEYDEWFRRIRERRQPAIVYIDELSSVCNKAGEAGLEFTKLQKQGRGLHICTITSSQELGYIPRQVIGQMTHFVRFGLGNEYDCKLGNRLCGRPNDEAEPPDTFGFWYTRRDKRPLAPRYYRGHQAFL